MNYARLALMVAGMGFLLLAAAVLYYRTDLRNDIPEGAAVAAFLGITGLFILALSAEFGRARRSRDVGRAERAERVERAFATRPPRPAPRASRDEHEPEPKAGPSERIEVVERRD